MSKRKKLGLIAVIVFLIVLFYGLWQQVSSSLQGGKRLEAETEELVALQKRNNQLKKKLNEVKSIRFIEEVARNKLNLAREGETVVLISQEAMNKVLQEEKKQEKISLPNWQGWLKLFWK